MSLLVVCLVAILPGRVYGGPYDEPGVHGFIDGDGLPAPSDANMPINPIFRGWATGYVNYLPAPEVYPEWADPAMALGPVTGDSDDVVSLGDLRPEQIATGVPPGEITLTFGDPKDANDLSNPLHAIRNGQGYDFVVFENDFISNYTGGGSVSGKMFAELAYVEVSSDGVHFARFPSVSVNEQPQVNELGYWPFATIEISNVHNLAGRHPNAYGLCFGTPFNLDDIADDPCVAAGRVDPNNIRYVRIVDIPGSGDFFDAAAGMVDPSTAPTYDNYGGNHAVYDAWVTWESGGFDLEAIGVLSEQKHPGDINLNGVVDLLDLAVVVSCWQSRWGIDQQWVTRCDISLPRDYVIDLRDLMVLAADWLEEETWRVH